ncbi:hypothetical protein BJP40_01225 [Streptomyces sp. CC53]|uniref:LamG-like jellyroll fold domain-containing protein n=1 Tax=Streptomyces sp. CC53 TaxID=1906740 RepID=UPI0008DD292E|nr:LamG-like jellyroll fold domain-containing protein [Streptomyces sp. CC53]OII65542.1 hypothetical protein BJP40_01225 [Streptomyces sp. CC53]
MDISDSRVKVYSDRRYTRTTAVRHQGTTLAFAMDDQRRIVYSVLALDGYDPARGDTDAAYWSENPRELSFPQELNRVGYAALGTVTMPRVKKGGRAEADPGQVLDPEETNAFLSSTARLTADVPFQVLSDGTHVIVLRQSIAAGHPDAVREVTPGAASAAGTEPPLVDGLLLCDRFLMVGGILKPVRETRYRRSRMKHRPGSAKDSLGASDMEGKPFYEPTQAIGFVRNLSEGRFAAVLVPTSVAGAQRWQFFAWNTVTGRMDAFSVDRSADGLFTTQGNRAWTSPDPRYQGAVYERGAGPCPFTGAPLVPVRSESGFGETALRLATAGAQGTVDTMPRGPEFTVQAWVNPARQAATTLLTNGYTLELTDQGCPRLRAGDSELTGTQPLPAGRYTHLTATYADGTATLYLDGTPCGSGAFAFPGEAAGEAVIGGTVPEGGFALDELRVWDRALGPTEIREDLGHRLVGDEPGLVAYYRFDGGAGSIAYDQTDAARHAALTGEVSWETSTAPIGDHAGIRRDSFTFANREPVSAPSAVLYHQQETRACGYDAAAKPVKSQARVLLACATRDTADPHSEPCLATLDFGVGVDGRLAQTADVVILPEIGTDAADTGLERQSLLEQRIQMLRNEIAALEPQVPPLAARCADLAATRNQVTSAQQTLDTAQARWDTLRYDPTDWTSVRMFFNNSVGRYAVQALNNRLTLGESVVGGSSTQTSSVWKIEHSGLTHSGRPQYYVYTYDRAYRLNVYNAATNDQAHIELYPTTTTDYTSEQLTLTRLAGNVWRLVARHSGKTLALRYGSEYNRIRQYTDSVLSGSEGRCEIESLGSRSGADTAVATARDDLTRLQAALDVKLAAQEQLDAVNLQLTTRRDALSAAEDELALLTAGMAGADDVVVPAVHLGTDPTGLTVCGGLLAFARTADAPFLMDSSTGQVALYFRGLNGQFFAAYYDTRVVRGSKVLGSGASGLLLTAWDASVDLSGVTVTVSEVPGQPALCDLTLDRPGEREVWRGLPRHARTLVDVLTGAPEGDPPTIGVLADPGPRTGPAAPPEPSTVLPLAAPLAQPLAAPAYLATDDGVRLLTASAGAGAVELHLDAPCLPSPGSPVRVVRYDTRLAEAERPGADLRRGSRLVTAAAGYEDARIADGTATQAVAGHGCRWRGASPGRALAFDGATQHLGLAPELVEQTAIPSDVTVEAWVNPYAMEGTSRLVHAANGEDAPYSLLLTDAVLRSAVAFSSDSAHVTVDRVDLTGGPFTVETWLRRTTAGYSAEETVAAQGSSGTAGRSLALGYRASGAFFFSLGGGEDLQTAGTYADTDWHHWAATYDPATGAQVLYRDGVETARRTATAPYTGAGTLVLGRAVNGTRGLRGTIDQPRLWGRARTAAELRDLMRQNVTGSVPGLLASWTSTSGQLLDTSGHGRHGIRHGDATEANAHATGYRVVFGVGERAVRSREVHPAGEWAHLAAAFEQSWAVRLDGAAWLDGDNDDTLDLTGDLTLEVFCRLDRLGITHGLVTRGRLGSDDTAVPYQLSVRPDGRLEFAFEEAGGTARRFVSSATVPVGRFTRLAAVRRAGRETAEQKGTREITLTNPDGSTTVETVDVIQDMEVRSWDDITFYIDGAACGTSRYTGGGPGGGEGALELGRVWDGPRPYAAQGVLGEVRIWNTAREAATIGAAVSPRDSGLAARFTFEENEGNTSTDTTGSHAVRLRGATWTRNPDPQGSRFRLYRDGSPMPTEPLDPGAPDHPAANGAFTQSQFTLGARRAGTAVTEALDGTLEEVRVWRTARTAEQISDNLFTRLKGDKEDLVGYWPFDRDSTAVGATRVRDLGLRGNDLEVGAGTPPTVVLSTAPVSTDTAAVRSAISGVRTAFHQTIAGTPATAEYADMQYRPDGSAAGVMKRAYSYLNDSGRWALVTGYKVGDLVSEWVSQVQYDPQLVGYLEGAPPVPSENLTGENGDYAGASAVTFTTADSVTESLSSSRNRSVDTAFQMAFQNEYDAETLLITAPLGIGTAQPAVEGGAVVSVDNTLEFSNTWSDETSLAQSTDTERATSVSLAGYWEDPARLLNPALGRRYQPANVGMALVQSQTADVFALRLAHSGALVAYRMRANPDIPRDWNILTFPINPQYTKQGTLDGGVGFDEHGKVLDPAYPNALQYGEYSYFKPREAYALKRAIQRQQQQTQDYYDNVTTRTGTSDPVAGRAKKIAESFVGPIGDARDTTAGEGSSSSAASAFAVRDLANTYLWTADGGFFAETTTTADAMTETAGGSYSVTDMLTAGVEFGFSVFGVGIAGQLNASIGGSHSVTRTKSEDASRSYGLDVTCEPSGDLQAYHADGKAVFDPQGRPVLVPGKVDAYRFMSFYLHESGRNFDDFFHKVVDPVWLADSNAPSAAALRQTRQSDRKPPCWRVLHRVTFISRVLPPVPGADAPPLERDLARVDIASNYELVRRLDPYVRHATSSLGELSDATRTALTAHLPELLPHQDDIRRFLAQYYGVED